MNMFSGYFKTSWEQNMLLTLSPSNNFRNGAALQCVKMRCCEGEPQWVMGPWDKGAVSRSSVSNNLRSQAANEAADTNPPRCKWIKIMTRRPVNSKSICLGSLPQIVSRLEVRMQSGKATHTEKSVHELSVQVEEIWRDNVDPNSL